MTLENFTLGTVLFVKYFTMGTEQNVKKKGDFVMSDLANYLFETNAIRFCDENKPFWYTSGKIGPYFINTP